MSFEETSQLLGRHTESTKSLSFSPTDPSINREEQLINAVHSIELCRHYGSFRRKLPVLKGISMTVPKGRIYGLLGPSGCGKTTLIKTIMGRLKIHGGSLSVLGGAPGAKGHCVPGPSIGYMPQELALYPEFTTRETLLYFGKLHGMESSYIESRMRFLLEFLDMQNLGNRLIKEMSGGQQRRVSLAVALLHEPRLLILDEPTVGVSSILRAKIWEHLVELVKSTGTTVIITTHYIEEARQADIVAMMGDGRLLVEDSPSNLLLQFQKNSLEEVFLSICQQVEARDAGVESLSDNYLRSTGFSSLLTDKPNSTIKENPITFSNCCSAFGTGASAFFTSFWKDSRLPIGRNIHALIWKNFIRYKRNYGLLLFQFMLPAIQIILFCVAIGRDPEGLNVAFVNNDEGEAGSLYLSFVDDSAISLVNYTSTQLAIDDIRAGSLWGVLSIGSNFTSDLAIRFGNPGQATLDVIIGSSVNLTMDMTNQQIAIVIQEKLSFAFQSLAHFVLRQMGRPEELADLPLRILDPVYGNMNPTFTDFIAPAMIINIAFAMSIGLTALSFVLEKKEGLLDRSWVAGISPGEVLISHTVTQFVTLLVQLALLLLFALVVFDAPMEGSLPLVILLSVLLGLAGMAFGLLISSVSKDEVTAVQLALGSFYPVMLLSGVLWPVEAIPHGLRYVSYALPTTWASNAMRSLMSRGWSMDHQDVYAGFIATVVWSLVLLLFALRGISSRD